MTGPGEKMAAVVAGRGYLLASDADREQVIDVLKAAFVQGRLDTAELDLRVGQALASRTYAELARVTADIPAGLAGAQPPRKPPRRQMSKAARWGASGFMTPVILATAPLVGDDKYKTVAFLIASIYFLVWLQIGANMLWEWHLTSLPATKMCARCGHTATSHRAPASSAVRLGSLKLQRRYPCAGYVPPGTSPETVDMRLVAACYL
jgi:hypothetical protein